MYTDCGSGRKEFVRIVNGELQFSSIGYLWKMINEDFYTVLPFPEPIGYVELPFCTAFLVIKDSWMRFFVHSDAHRELIKSTRFAEKTKPLAKWVIKEGLSGRNLDGYIDSCHLYTPIYEELFKIHAPLQHDLVKNVLNPKKDETILEIGCGTGDLSVLLSKDVKSVTGADLIKHYVERARKKAEKLGLKNCRFVNVNYPCNLKEEFDHAIVFNVAVDDEKFQNHLFPSREVLFGSFAYSKSVINVEILKAINQSIHNFEDNYRISRGQRSWKELGDYLYFEFVHLERK